MYSLIRESDVDLNLFRKVLFVFEKIPNLKLSWRIVCSGAENGEHEICIKESKCEITQFRGGGGLGG